MSAQRLWILRDETGIGPWDEYTAFVVWAPDETTARALAETHARDEDKWLDAEKTSCNELDLEEPADPEVVLAAWSHG